MDGKKSLIQILEYVLDISFYYLLLVPVIGIISDLPKSLSLLLDHKADRLKNLFLWCCDIIQEPSMNSAIH